jgi:hypothetical protein
MIRENTTALTARAPLDGLLVTFPPALQGFFQLPGPHAFNGDGLDLFSNSSLFEEAVEG